jgi:hypothetical protein
LLCVCVQLVVIEHPCHTKVCYLRFHLFCELSSVSNLDGGIEAHLQSL